MSAPNRIDKLPICNNCATPMPVDPCHRCGWVRVDAEAREALQGAHPGFKITCQTCNQEAVGVENTLGFSTLSGAWGAVKLRCAFCEAETALVEVGR